jgi:hypothetical protein
MSYESFRIRRPFFLGILALLGILSHTGVSQAQGPQGGGFQPGGGEMVTLDAVKSRIQASDEEWKVIGPKLRKLMTTRRAAELSTNSTGTGGMGGGRGGRGGPGGGNDSFSGPSNFGSGGFGGPGGPGGRGPGGFGGRGGFGGPGGGPDDFGPGGPGGFGPGGFGGRGGPPPGNADPAAQNKPNTDKPASNTSVGSSTPNSPKAPTAGQPLTRGQAAGGPNQPNFGGPPPGFGGMGGGGGGDAAVTKAMADLQTALADTKTKPAQLEEKVAAVRLARSKAKEKFEAARKDLFELLTPEQEAVLIALGYLE